jgi:surface polysaccharide O-acyltransferase-like enzyme
VEVLRVVAVMAVLVIHATPFNQQDRLGAAWDAATVANQLARFAVPAFFVLAGYFWAGRVPEPRGPDPVTRRMVGRLLLLFAVWSLVYVFPYDGALLAADVPRAWLGQLERNARWIATHPGTVLLQGTNGHLWFLPALASAVAIAAVVRRWLGWRVLVAVAILAAAYALLALPYARTPWGLAVGYNARNGPALALPCVVIGMALARHAPTPAWVPRGAALLVGGALLSAVEATWLAHAHQVRLTHDVLAGTFAFGTGAAMLGLANPAALRQPRVAAMGSAVLGIYLIHPIGLDLLQPELQRARAPWADLAGMAAVFLLSLGLSRALARSARWRWMVTTR